MGMLNPSKSLSSKAPPPKGIERQVKDMLQNGIKYYSLGQPCSFVRKADKTSRLYIDYRNLYKTTIKGSYPLPHNRDILDMLHRNYLFMALDLLKALHQITRLILKKLVVKKQLLPHMLGSSNTCFLFGLTNAPPSFQCLQEHVL